MRFFAAIPGFSEMRKFKIAFYNAIVTDSLLLLEKLKCLFKHVEFK